MEIEQQREHAYEVLAHLQEAAEQLNILNFDGLWKPGVVMLRDMHKQCYEEFDRKGLL